MSTSGSKLNEPVAHFLVDIHTLTRLHLFSYVLRLILFASHQLATVIPLVF